MRRGAQDRDTQRNRLSGSCVPPTMKTMRAALAGIPVAVLLAGCGSQTATTDAASTQTGSADDTPSAAPAPKGLTCPSGERVGTAGGYLAEYPEGPDTPEEVVEEKSTEDEPWVLVGRKAYVLRPDGTAYEVHDVVKGPNGWFLHGYEACAD